MTASGGHPGLDPGSTQRHRSAPRLETERLILRSFTADDLDAHAATLGDADVMRHLGGTGLDREDAWRRMSGGVGQWPLTGMGMWAVERKVDARMVGHVGFFDMRRDMTPSIAGQPEMGWILDRSVHGQGIALEACRAAIAWAEATFGAIDIPAIISPDNGASIRLAEKLGFEPDADAIYKGEPIALFRRRAQA